MPLPIVPAARRPAAPPLAMNPSAHGGGGAPPERLKLRDLRLAVVVDDVAHRARREEPRRADDRDEREREGEEGDELAAEPESHVPLQSPRTHDSDCGCTPQAQNAAGSG